MPIRSVTNPYCGVNAHLNSILQNEPGDWESFHANHIINLRDALDKQLPPGYLARGERGLQISELRVDTDTVTSRTKPDVTIFQTSKFGSGGYAPTLEAVSLTAPTLTLPVEDTLSDAEDEYLTGIVIYRTGGGRIGDPVTRIELLSPANKPPQGGYREYVHKRDEALKSGLRLVELDYLHQSRSVIARLPSYPAREKGAYPYTVVVSDPRPSLTEGKVAVYGLSVNQAFGLIPIPLAAQEVLKFDFGAIYNVTFEANRYHYEVVDYELLPERFETYREDDQAQIRQVMQAIQAAAQSTESAP